MAKPKNVDTVAMDFTDTVAAEKAAMATSTGPNPTTVSGTGNTGEVVYNVAAPAAVDPKPEGGGVEKTRNTKTFDHEGVKVYEIDTDTKLYQFFDSDGNPVDDNVVENLRIAYPTPPDQDDLGTNKVGPFVIREVDDNNQTPQDANYSGTSTMIAERQNYESGQAFTKTILKKYYNVVRVLRGEIGLAESEDKEG